MSQQPEATEDSCPFVKIIQRNDYTDNKHLRSLIRHYLSRGLVCILRGREVEGVNFELEDMEEMLCLDRHTRIDVQGEQASAFS